MTAPPDPAAPQAAPPLAQCASAVLTVRPSAFGTNPETAASNAFQSRSPATPAERVAVVAEFDGVVAALQRAGVEVLVAGDTAQPPKPDAVFPNNWLSLHHDGTAVLYPMLSPLRRAERRRDVLDALAARGFVLRRVLDLSGWEAGGLFLEGTGSMVLDHRERVAYACLSPRTCLRPLAQLCAELGYEAHPFRACGPDGAELYHTNVLMSLGQDFAAVCLDAVDDAAERHRLCERLAGCRELLELDRAQMHGFAGNMLALRPARGAPLVAMSEAAWRVLRPGQRRQLERHGSIVTAALPVIERLGGGSLRCMLAEVFLPRSEQSDAPPA